MARSDALDISDQGNTKLYKEVKTITFDGGTADGIGDFDGAGNPVTLFNVTGDVLVNVFAICTTDLAGASATVEIGTASSTAALCSQKTATDVNEHMAWHDNVLAVGGQVAGHMHPVDEDIILTVGTANITAGVLKIYVEFRPLSADGDVRAA